MTTVAAHAHVVTGGVDTHLDVHVAAALDPLGTVLGTSQFPASAGGYRQLLAWLRTFGEVGRIGVEGTGSYGVLGAIPDDYGGVTLDDDVVWAVKNPAGRVTGGVRGRAVVLVVSLS